MSARSLLSITLQPAVVDDVRRSLDPKLALSSHILQRANAQKTISVDEVFTLLSEKPLTPEEKSSGRNIIPLIEKTFMFQLEDMI